jgi:restriction endonuclease Mrr
VLACDCRTGDNSTLGSALQPAERELSAGLGKNVQRMSTDLCMLITKLESDMLGRPVVVEGIKIKVGYKERSDAARQLRRTLEIGILLKRSMCHHCYL